MASSAKNFVHPQALCESEAVGAGTRIWAFAHVMKGAVVGSDCNICDHAFVESGARIGDRVTIKNQVMVWAGVQIGDDVFVGPGATFTNDLFPRSPRMNLPVVAARYHDPENWLVETRVEKGASLGARSTIVAGITIGAYAMVAAGAVVTHDVPAYGLLMGVPARRVGWACPCGARLRLLKPGATTWRCATCDVSFEEQAECISLVRSS